MAGKRVAIYINEDDVEAWKELSNKSQWVHDMLNGNDTDIDVRIRRIVKQEIASIQSQY